MTVTNTQNKYMPKSYLLGGALIAGVLLGTSVHASADEVTNANNGNQNTSTAKPAQAQIGVDVNHNSVDKATQEAKDAGVKVTTNTNTKTVSADEADSAKKSVEENEAQQAQNVADTTKQQQANIDATNQANAQIDKANANSQNQTDQANAQLQNAIQKAKDAGVDIEANGVVKHAYDNTQFDNSNADTVKQSVAKALVWLKTNTDKSVQNANDQTQNITDVTNQYVQAVHQLEQENDSLQAQRDALAELQRQATQVGINVNTNSGQPFATSDYQAAKQKLEDQINDLAKTLQQYKADYASWKQQYDAANARNQAKADGYNQAVANRNQAISNAQGERHKTGTITLNDKYGGFLNGSIDYDFTYHWDQGQGTFVVTNSSVHYNFEPATNHGSGFRDSFYVASPTSTMPPDNYTDDYTLNNISAEDIYNEVASHTQGLSFFLSHNNKTDEFLDRENSNVNYNAVQQADGSYVLGVLAGRYYAHEYDTGQPNHDHWFISMSLTDNPGIPTEPQAPTYETLPTAPIVPSVTITPVDYTRNVTHAQLSLPSSAVDSYSVEHINKPADLPASVTKTNLIAEFSQPQKTVTIDGQDVNGKTLARGTKLQYTLASDALPANRTDDIQDVSDDDTLSDSLTFNGWHAYQKQADGSLVDVTSEYKLTQNGQNLHWEATPALLARYNQNKSQKTNQAYIVIDTTVNADDKKIQNTYSHTLNGRTDSSNTDSNVSVKVTPHKSVLNSDGQSTNGMALEQGDDVHYAIDWDMTGFDQNTAYSKDQEATGLSITDKYSDLFLPTKNKLSIFDSKGDDVTKDVDITWGDDTVTIKAKNVKDFISKYGQSTLRINFIGTVKQDAQSGEMSNTAYQNDFGDEHATETVVNKITVTSPSKTAEVNGQVLKDGDKVVLNSVLPYVVQSSPRPANVGEPTKAWSLSDKFDAEYDQYLGQWTITASRDFTMPDGTVVKAGTSLNDYFGNQLANYFTVDYRNGTLSASLTDKMLAIMNSDTNRKTEQAWSLTAVTKRIKDGTAHNTGVEKYNNRTTNTNTVSTVTPKVYTSWVDETGAPLKPEIEGTFPGGDISGYKFLRTVTDGDGNTTNFYQSLHTSWLDENGQSLKPQEKGLFPGGDIAGYKFIRSVTDKDGNIENIYRALYTSWVDENGNPLKPQEKGLFPGGDISGYKFVKTMTDKDGNLVNLYEKIVKPVVTPTATPEPQVQAPVVPQSPMPATGKDAHNDNKALLGLAVASALALFGTTYRRQTA